MSLPNTSDRVTVTVPWDILIALAVFVILLFTGPPALAAPLTATTKFDADGLVSRGYQRAVTAQSHRLAAEWGTGTIEFGAGGVPVFPVPHALMQRDCYDADAIACHEDNGLQMFILIEAGMPRWETQYALDHEMLETMVDPYPDYEPTIINGQLAEVCDPLEYRPVTVATYTLAPFVGPSYFNQ